MPDTPSQRHKHPSPDPGDPNYDPPPREQKQAGQALEEPEPGDEPPPRDFEPGQTVERQRSAGGASADESRDKATGQKAPGDKA